MSYIDYPPLQLAASYNLEQVLQQVKEMARDKAPEPMSRSVVRRLVDAVSGRPERAARFFCWNCISESITMMTRLRLEYRRDAPGCCCLLVACRAGLCADRSAAVVERRRRPSRRSSSSCRRPPTQGSPKFVPPAERIATFDQDGTLWVEHPMYTQVMYCLERVPAVVKAKPELAKVEPFKTVLSGNREAMAKLPMQDLEKILAATLTGMSVDEFNAEVKKWLADGQGSALEAALHRAHLPADAGGAEVPARQRLQDLHRHRRRPGLRARVLRGRPTAFRPSRWSAPRAGRSTATTRTASRS